MPDIIPIEAMANIIIYQISNQEIILNRDLSPLYSIDTNQQKRAGRRNISHSPDFMLELTPEEFKNVRSQIDTSRWSGTRYPAMAFTEPGVAMLFSVLSSEQIVSPARRRPGYVASNSVGRVSGSFA